MNESGHSRVKMILMNSSTIIIIVKICWHILFISFLRVLKGKEFHLGDNWAGIRRYIDTHGTGAMRLHDDIYFL